MAMILGVSSSSSLQHQQLVVTQRNSLLPNELQEKNNVKVMLDAKGNSYSCVLPTRPARESTSEMVHAEQPSRDELNALLDSTLGKTCLYRQEGIWTFEACFKKHTRQFRKSVPQVQISGGATYTIEARPAEEFSGGLHHEEDDQEISIFSDQILTGTRTSFASLQLKGGAGCVMTGGNRTSEMRFSCGGSSHSSKENTLIQVKEFPTCHYIYVISVPTLCNKFPWFAPPSSSSSIDCFLRLGNKLESGEGSIPRLDEKESQPIP